MSGIEDSPAEEASIWSVFRISLYIKAGLSILELVSSAALYLVSSEALLRMARVVTRHELLQNPNEIIANFLMRTADQLSLHQKSVAAIYLFTHGAVKLFLVIMVLRNKLWAYPLFIIALVLLIAYQSYQLTFGLSVWLAGLTAFDVIVLGLTLREYSHIGAKPLR